MIATIKCYLISQIPTDVTCTSFVGSMACRIRGLQRLVALQDEERLPSPCTVSWIQELVAFVGFVGSV